MVSDSSERYARLNRVLEEIAGCYRRGEHPSLQVYLERYPDLADDLGELFPAMAEIEQVKEDRREKQGSPMPALRQLGDYRILREVGHGGMGIVYEAEQESLGRRVALKVLLSHTLLEARQVQRFQREARTAARLHHTNIVPVFGVGEHDGMHYYVMQFIYGQGLDQVLTELNRLRQPPASATQQKETNTPIRAESSLSAIAHSLLTGVFASPQSETPAEEPNLSGSSTPGRLPQVDSAVHLPGQPERAPLSDSGRQYWQSVARIGIQAAEALAYAHTQGTLHRDIKPSNLLLDTQGTVWITDFGLAKATDSDPDNLTRTGDVVGTLRYMAPERFKGKADARSDLYALGLTLYELLTLRPAFEETERSRLLVRVLHDEPTRPRKLNPAVPRDLETIILKAIARDPDHRYASAGDLAEDLRRFLDDKPIQARPVSEVEKLWRWCRRNPALAGLVSAFVLSLLVGSAGISWKWWEAEQRREEAIRASNAADRARNESLSLLAGVMLDKGVALAEQGEVGEGLFWMLEALKKAPRDAPELHKLIRTDLAAWMSQTHGLRHIIEQPRSLGGCAFTPDGQSLVSWGDGVRCYPSSELGTRSAERRKTVLSSALRVPSSEFDRQSGPIAFSPEGKMLLACNSRGKGKEGHPQCWDAVNGQPIGAPLHHPQTVTACTFTPDGKRIATACQDGTVRLWDSASGELLSDRFGHPRLEVRSVAISPDGTTLAVATGVPENDLAPAAAYLWDLVEVGALRGQARSALGKPIGQPLHHKGAVASVVFSPDGKSVLTASSDGTTQLWDATSGKPVGLSLRHPHLVLTARFSPDGRMIVTGSADGIVRWWDVTTGSEVLGSLPMHHGAINDLAFSPDGKTLAAVSKDDGKPGALHVWQLTRPLSRPAGKGKEASLKAPWVVDHIQWTWMSRQRVAYSPDTRRVLTWGSAGVARMWDSLTGQPLGVPLRHRWKNVFVLAFSPDGKTLATTSQDQTAIGDAYLWDAATGKALAPPLPHFNWVSALAFRPDGKLRVTGSYDWTLRFWDPATGKQIGSSLSQGGVV